jgi:2-oxoglutarate dehydrogenase E2 component (dihydrolipoamide succinyltransferase)
MSVEVKVPTFPESIAEGEIAEWHKAPGDAVAEGETIVEIETDKVVLEVPAMHDGVMGDHLKAEGDTVTSTEVIGHMEEGAVAATKTADQPDIKTEAPKVESTPAPQAAAKQAEVGQDGSPAVRRIASENDVKVADVPGTGKAGRVTALDVKQYVSGGARKEERVKMTRLRKTVAGRLMDVQATTAMLTTFNEVDMTAVKALRAQYKDKFEKSHGTRLGFMSFFMKAATEALKRFPSVNASIDGEEIVYHNYFDISVAVASPRGLVVPVVRDVDQLSMAGIEQSIRDFAGKAKNGTLTIEEMQGGTFTITNGGTFGSMLSTPILNAPQSAILGMHNIVDRAMVVDGEIKVRPVMYVALTYDHRIIDGSESVQFLRTIKECLEDPARLLLAV